jgi:hypothetical protein
VLQLAVRHLQAARRIVRHAVRCAERSHQRSVWPQYLQCLANLLQPELRHVRERRRDMFARALRIDLPTDQQALRDEHMQRRASVLQPELRDLRGSGRDL